MIVIDIARNEAQQSQCERINVNARPELSSIEGEGKILISGKLPLNLDSVSVTFSYTFMYTQLAARSKIQNV